MTFVALCRVFLFTVKAAGAISDYGFTVYLMLFTLVCCINTYFPYLQALGSMYFIHNTLKDIYQYDFHGKAFVFSGMTQMLIFITLLSFSSSWVSFNACRLCTHTECFNDEDKYSLNGSAYLRSPLLA